MKGSKEKRGMKEGRINHGGHRGHGGRDKISYQNSVFSMVNILRGKRNEQG
jgi:hypothetical protein